MQDKKDSIKSGLFWKFAERICAQGVSFVLSMILARILMPEDYGIVAILLVFINLANVFVSDGFSTALIQKKGVNDLDYSTMFYCSVAVSLVMYTLLFFLAPTIALFYNNVNLIWPLRILSLKLPIAAVNSIQHAYVSRNMMFKKFFWSTLIGTVISAVVGIFMAMQGLGVWALVAQYLTNSIIDTLVLFFTIPWYPKIMFSIDCAKRLMSYGWKITLGSLAITGYTQLRSLIIGKFYTAEDLAFYNKGDQIPSLVVNNVNASVASVIFPAMSNCEGNVENVKKIAKQSMRMAAYVIFPMMGGLCVVAEKLIVLLLTSKWVMTVPYMQLACISYALMPISTSNIQAIKAMGRSDLYLKMEIIKKGIGIILVIISVPFGTMTIAVTAVISSVINNVVNIFPNKKLLNYGYKEQIKDLLPAIFMTIIMCISIYPVEFLNLSPVIIVFFQVVLGIVVYVLISAISNNSEYKYVLNTIFKRGKNCECS